MLRKFGLEDKRDYTVVEAPFPTMRAMLAEKKVDLIPAVLPFSLDPELRKISRPLFISSDAIGVDADDHLARAQVLHRQEPRRDGRLHGGHAAHRALVPRPSEPQGLPWRSPARVTKQPVERFDWIFTKRDYLPRSRHAPNLDALQKNIDMTKDLGFVRASFDVKKHTDLSLVEEAAKRLK